MKENLIYEGITSFQGIKACQLGGTLKGSFVFRKVNVMYVYSLIQVNNQALKVTVMYIYIVCIQYLTVY